MARTFLRHLASLRCQGFGDLFLSLPVAGVALLYFMFDHSRPGFGRVLLAFEIVRVYGAVIDFEPVKNSLAPKPKQKQLRKGPMIQSFTHLRRTPPGRRLDLGRSIEAVRRAFSLKHSGAGLVQTCC